MAQMVKNLPAMQETWVQSLGQEASLEKGMAIHSTILVWKIPMTEEPGRLQSRELQESATKPHHYQQWDYENYKTYYLQLCITSNTEEKFNKSVHLYTENYKLSLREIK